MASIQKYGPASEKLSDAQLELLEVEPGVSNLEVQAVSAREPLPAGIEGTPRTRRQRPHPGRQELPADLPRVERVIGCAPEECPCSHCGQPTTVIGSAAPGPPARMRHLHTSRLTIGAILIPRDEHH